MSTRDLLKSSLLISIGLFSGRVLGYIRDILIANQYGVSQVSDDLFVLLTFPDFINNLISSSSIGVLIIPLLNNNTNDRKIISGYIDTCLKVSFLLLFVAILILLFFYDTAFSILLMISLFSIFPNIINVILNAYLNFKNHFLWPSFGTVFFSLPILLAIFYKQDLIVVAIAIIAGAFFRVLPTIFVTKKFGLNNYIINKNSVKPKMKTVVLSIISTGLFSIFPFIDKIFASKINLGSVSYLTLSEKLIMLPISLLITPIAIANFPKVSRLLNSEDKLSLINFLKINYSIIIAISISVVMFFLFFSDIAIKIVFGITSLQQNDLIKINLFLNAFLGYILFSGLNLINFNILFALKKMRLVFILSIFLFFLKIILNSLNAIFIKNELYIIYSTSILSSLQFLISFFFILKLKSKINYE